jgi:hypothetical protein
MKDDIEHWYNYADRWNPMYSEDTCPRATLSTTNPNGLGSREILRCKTNRLSQGTTKTRTHTNTNYVITNIKYTK